MKIFLHVLAFGCVFISYRIGWQLSQKRWVAFAVGLVVAITPDLYFYSNVVLSEVINIFIVLAFCTILLTALETRTFRWTIALTLTGSFATLLRPENITLLVIGGIFLIIAPIRQIIGLSISLELRNRSLRELGLLGIAFILALLPIVWWSGHNYKVNGFFGLSNYAKEVFYDGWVYDGISQGYSMKNGESSAEKKIDAAIEKYPVVGTDPSGVPTGWEIYPSLLKTGYSTTQAMDLLGEAAWDSILANPASAARLLLRKFTGDAFEPIPAQMTTFSLSGEIEQGDEMKLSYFDFEKLKIPFLIQFQRLIYNFQQYLYGNLYSFWILLCLLALTISLSRSPTSIWVALILITTTRILVSNILGISLWRYTLAGLIPLEIIAVNWLAVSVYGIKTLFLKPNQV